jgi:non-heme chloroperoxidase
MDHRIWESQQRYINLCQITHLRNQKFRVICLDFRGHGNSAKSCSDQYNLDGFSDDLGVVLKSLHLSETTIVGWSIGPTTLLRYLERFGSNRTSKPALVSGPVNLTASEDYPYDISDEIIDQILSEFIGHNETSNF